MGDFPFAEGKCIRSIDRSIDRRSHAIPDIRQKKVHENVSVDVAEISPDSGSSEHKTLP